MSHLKFYMKNIRKEAVPHPAPRFYGKKNLVPLHAAPDSQPSITPLPHTLLFITYIRTRARVLTFDSSQKSYIVKKNKKTFDKLKKL